MKYLFYISKIYSIPIIKPLVRELENRSEEFVFYVSDKVKKNAPESWENVYTDLKKAKDFNPDFVLCPGNFVDFRIPGVKVQTFHGLGIEKDSHYKIRHFFDIFLTSGPFVTEKFKKLQNEHKYFDIIETGWPKIDYILNYDSENIREDLELPKNKKIILYAPTFSSKLESVTDLIDVIPETIREDEFWLFKFHELMDKEIIENLKNRLPENTAFLNVNDITPFLHAADIMISDTSSVIYEFLSLNKPVVTYKTKARKSKGIDIRKPEKLRKALDHFIKNPNLYEKQRKKNINQVNPYLDGNISKRVFDELEKINPEDYPKKGKPLNLFRKWQIVYHSIFRKGYLR